MSRAARMVVVLAAGEGKRMKSATPKVLHPLLGRSLVGHVLAAARPLGAERTLVVTGRGAQAVNAHLAEIAPYAEPVLQAEQRGTGHAVAVAMAGADDFAGTVVVLNGDVPLLRPETLAAMLATHEDNHASATVLSALVADPSGLGRIIRHPGGTQLRAIVEERDATAQQREIYEINAGVYAFDAAALRLALKRLSSDNDQAEQYLTDVFGLLVADGATVAVHVATDPEEGLGCNDRAQLADLRARLRNRVNLDWMFAGVSIVDPTTTWIDVTVALEPDSTVEPNTHLRGATSVAAGAVVGPDTTLTDVRVGPGATVLRTHGTGAEIGPDATVGPFALLRPGARLGAKGKIGTFVEVKNSEIGPGTKVPHLTYVGDATIGEQSNIGAATVFVNYDGVAKHRTVIGSHARTGADNMFVAPVEIGDGAYTAAGSVITEDVPPGALGVSRARQRNVDGWVARRRPGTAAAEAAERANRDRAGGDEAGGDRSEPPASARGDQEG